jgi:hypothetical protein
MECQKDGKIFLNYTVLWKTAVMSVSGYIQSLSVVFLSGRSFSG